MRRCRYYGRFPMLAIEQKHAGKKVSRWVFSLKTMPATDVAVIKDETRQIKGFANLWKPPGGKNYPST